MKVSDSQVKSMKSFVLGDVEGFARIRGSFDLVERRTNARLMTAVFSEAVRRRFRVSASYRSEIIRFVSRVRTDSPEAMSNLDPATSEKILAGIASDESISDVDGRSQGVHMAILLPIIVEDLRLEEPALDALIDDACELLESWDQEQG